MNTADLIARLRAGTVTPEICEAAAVALERARDTLEICALEVDCSCDNRCAVLAVSPNSGERWRLCSHIECGAIEAENIRALKGTTK